MAFALACGLGDAQAGQWTAARDALTARQVAQSNPARDPEATSPDPTALVPVHRPVPTMLPPDIADFTGRAVEVSVLTSHLAPGGSGTAKADGAVHPNVETRSGRVARMNDTVPARALPIAAVSGMAGIGKTALALHVAHILAPSYPDGQLWINLGGAQDRPLEPADVLTRFLRALGVHDRAIPPDPDERAEVYRMRLAGRSVLVVLDNARSEEQVRPLFPGVGTCAVMVTSRTRLSGIEGARQLDLTVFSRVDALRLLRRVSGEDRVSGQTAEAAQIIGLCANLPLAVRVAGARLAARPTWPLARLASMLADERQRLDRLAAGDLAVRSSLASSYRDLDAEQRRLFRLLGLFEVPDFPAWLAAAVGGSASDRAVEHVEALVDAQLLTVAGTDEVGQTRYRFHDLVRLFAYERALAEEPDERRRRALALGLGGWLALAERMVDRVPGPCFALISSSGPRPRLGSMVDRLRSVEAVDWFDAERGAMSAAVRQACRLNLDDLAFGLAGCLEKYFDVRGMYVDWSSLNAEVMAVCRRTGNQLGEAVMLRGLLDVTTWAGANPGGEAMRRYLVDSVRLQDMFLQLGHDAGAADAAVNCSWAHTAAGRHDEAVSTATRAIELAERSDHLGGSIRARLALGLALFEQGRFDVAILQTTRALEDARRLNNDRCLATALQFAGFAYREAGDLETGQRLLEHALALSRRYQDHYAEVLTLLGLARLYLRRGDPRARLTAEASLALSRQYTMHHHLADALALLGEIELAEGRPSRAIVHLQQSVAIWRSRGWLSFQATTLVTLGRACLGTDVDAAHRAFAEARELFTRLRNEAKVAELNDLIQGAVSQSTCPG